MQKKHFLAALLLTGSLSLAQSSEPVVTNDPTAAIAALRDQLIDSFNKGDMPRLLSHLDPDVVVTWQDGYVCRGPEQVKAYYERMMTGENRVVKTATADPKVTDRHVYGDWAVSWGEMNDHFVLSNDSEFNLQSKFTATIAKRGDAWKVTSFHVSGNLFQNEILSYAMKRTAKWTGTAAGGIAIIVGLLLGKLLSNRLKPKPVASSKPKGKGKGKA